MSFAAYIIHSATLDRFYVGHAQDPIVRLDRDHNGGRIGLQRFVLVFFLTCLALGFSRVYMTSCERTALRLFHRGSR